MLDLLSKGISAERQFTLIRRQQGPVGDILYRLHWPYRFNLLDI